MPWPKRSKKTKTVVPKPTEGKKHMCNTENCKNTDKLEEDSFKWIKKQEQVNRDMMKRENIDRHRRKDEQQKLCTCDLRLCMDETQEDIVHTAGTWAVSRGCGAGSHKGTCQFVRCERSPLRPDPHWPKEDGRLWLAFSSFWIVQQLTCQVPFVKMSNSSCEHRYLDFEVLNTLLK